MTASRLATRIVLLGSLLVSSAAVARSVSPADAPSDADLAAFSALGREMAARLDEVEALRARRAEVVEARERARAAFPEAEKTLEVAKISVREYLDGSYPQDKQTIEGEIKLAESELARATDRLEWSERMRKKGAVGDSQVLADKMSKQKSEISLSNAKQKMVVLENYTKVKQVTDLEANVKKAQAKRDAASEEFQRSSTKLATLDHEIAEADLTEGETRAVVRLDEALEKLDGGRLDEARRALAEARTGWDAAKTARERARFDAMKARIRHAADRARGRKGGE